MKCLFLLLLLSAGICSFAQPKETIHLHTDKDIYLPGETIWFKAYILSGNTPSASTNLYAGLYNQNGDLLNKKQFPVFNGSSSGDFEIADTFPHRSLQLRLFTKNMSAIDSNNAYIRIINIFRKDEPAQADVISNEDIQLQFFPEGGTLVAGIVNYIGFKAEKINGYPAVIHGVLTEADDPAIIDSVSTDTDGVGRIQFIPQFQKKYIVTWPDRNGIAQKSALPPAIHVGAVLHTDIIKNKLYYSIQKNNIFPRFDKLHLIVKSESDTIYKESVLLNKVSQFVNNLNTDSFPTGIIKILLSDDQNNILQQKYVYIPSVNKYPEIRVIEKNMTSKGKTVLEVVMPDTLLHTLSLSVTDLSFYSEPAAASIYDELLLANKNRPSLAFASAIHAADHRKTDLILLTTGRDAQTTYKKPVADDYMSLDFFYNGKNYPLNEKSSLMLIINDKGMGTQFLSADHKGEMNFSRSGLIYYDSAKVYFQLNNDKEISKRLSLVSPAEMKFPQKIKAHLPEKNRSEIKMPAAINDTYIEQRQRKFNEMQTVKTVVVKSKYVNPLTRRMMELDDKYASGMFKGIGRGYQLNALDDHAENYVDIFSYIIFRIPGLQTGGSFGSRYIRNIYKRGDEDGIPLLFINESVSPPETLENIDPASLAYVKYIPGIVITSSSSSASGALYIYLKKGDEPGYKSTGLRMAWVKGYNTGKDYFNPDYNDNSNLNTPDYRSTLYWNPYIITDKLNNRIRIEYYNNNIAKKHIVILKGFNENGTLVEVRKIID